eukprot:2663976-Rhodomonas_salina.1
MDPALASSSPAVAFLLKLPLLEAVVYRDLTPFGHWLLQPHHYQPLALDRDLLQRCVGVAVVVGESCRAPKT